MQGDDNILKLDDVFDYNAGTGTITSRNVMTFVSTPGDVGTYSIDNETLSEDQKNDILAIKESIVEK